MCSIGSGSKGNGTLVQHQNACLLVDNGFGLKDCINRMAAKGVSPEQLDAILVTHEHSDHGKGVGMLARKYGLPVYLSAGTYQALISREILRSYDEVVILEPDTWLDLIGIQVNSVPVPHDARETFQFIFKSDESCFGLLTDVGSITPHLIEQYAECKSLLLEFNHDEDMLWEGEYPEPLKYRVGGNFGHLNNEQALEFLKTIGTDQINTLVVSHVSEKNNDLSIVEGMLTQAFPDSNSVLYSTQEDGCPWVDCV